MVTPKSKREIKAAKRKLRKQIDDHKIELKELASDKRCDYHYNTVKSAFNEDSYYWNQSLAELALEIIEEKKNALITTK